MRLFMRSSTSAVNASSAYVIFENNKCMVLDTLEIHLRNVENGPTYYHLPLGVDFLRDVARQQFTILKAIEDSRVDATSEQQSRSQTTKVWDLFSQAFDDKGSGGGGGSSVFNSMQYNGTRAP